MKEFCDVIFLLSLLKSWVIDVSIWFLPFSSRVFQVYKATGEEFLKIAGGQISGFFFSFFFSSHLTMITWSYWKTFSVWGSILFHGFPALLKKEKKTHPLASVKVHHFALLKEGEKSPLCSNSPVTCVFASSQWLPYLRLMKGALWGVSPTAPIPC